MIEPAGDPQPVAREPEDERPTDERRRHAERRRDDRRQYDGTERELSHVEVAPNPTRGQFPYSFPAPATPRPSDHERIAGEPHGEIRGEDLAVAYTQRRGDERRDPVELHVECGPEFGLVAAVARYQAVAVVRESRERTQPRRNPSYPSLGHRNDKKARRERDTAAAKERQRVSRPERPEESPALRVAIAREQSPTEAPLDCRDARGDERPPPCWRVPDGHQPAVDEPDREDVGHADADNPPSEHPGDRRTAHRSRPPLGLPVGRLTGRP